MSRSRIGGGDPAPYGVGFSRLILFFSTSIVVAWYRSPRPVAPLRRRSTHSTMFECTSARPIEARQCFEQAYTALRKGDRSWGVRNAGRRGEPGAPASLGRAHESADKDGVSHDMVSSSDLKDDVCEVDPGVCRSIGVRRRVW